MSRERKKQCVSVSIGNALGDLQAISRAQKVASLAMRNAQSLLGVSQSIDSRQRIILPAVLASPETNTRSDPRQP